MPTPTGDWNINATGWHGILSLNDDGGGEVSGTVDFGDGDDPVRGAWNESAQQLVFVRTFGGGRIQYYLGFLFENTGNMFMGQGGPSGSPNFRVLAGNFDDVTSSAVASGQARFGWVARQSTA
jgi:hypothetical protein